MDKEKTIADQLADVLREIRQTEESEGFEGPKIAEYLLLCKSMGLDKALHHFENGRHLWEDHVVGEIVREVKAHRNPENHLEDWMIDFEDGGDGRFVAYIKDRLGHKLGVGQGPLALAAALAYRDALKEKIK